MDFFPPFIIKGFYYLFSRTGFVSFFFFFFIIRKKIDCSPFRNRKFPKGTGRRKKNEINKGLWKPYGAGRGKNVRWNTNKWT